VADRHYRVDAIGMNERLLANRPFDACTAAGITLDVDSRLRTLCCYTSGGKTPDVRHESSLRPAWSLWTPAGDDAADAFIATMYSDPPCRRDVPDGDRWRCVREGERGHHLGAADRVQELM
jgi:hypothetical protein